MKKFSLHIRTPEAEKTLHAPQHGAGSLADILRRHALPLNTRCGQRGLCEACIVELTHGTVHHLRTHAVLSAEGQPLSIRACEYGPAGDLHLNLPRRSLLTYSPQVLDAYAIRVTHANDPLLAARWGIAVDVGTTTVVAMLVDLETCKVAARASAFNAQMHLGDDVVTRITLCMNQASALRELQTALVEQTLAPLVQEILTASGAKDADVGGFVIAGNTTMLHILAGVDPTSLGIAPFTPTFIEHRVLRPGDLLGGWGERFPGAAVHLLPGAAAYIGSDIIAGLIATGMAYDPTTDLLVDVGTNGEIVLRHDGRLIGCATAAGPAFEGARLTSGMRAGDGAISAITLHPDTGRHDLSWIGQDRGVFPAGLCGSAYIDFLAEARRTGLLSATGRFQRDVGLRESWLENNGALPGYRLAFSQGRRQIAVHECDVASLLSAKAAIHAGIQMLLDHVQLRPADVRHVYLAGGFGTHMNAQNALGIGLLPAFTADQIVPVGNSSLAGAYLALTDKSLLADMQRTARSLEILELNLVPAFQDAYIDALSLP